MKNTVKLGIISTLIFGQLVTTIKVGFAREEISHVKKVASHLIGKMDTSQQAQVNPDRRSVRMTTCEVTVEGQPESFFLYQEQALTNKLNQPYRQRVLQLISHSNNQVESKSFKLLKQKDFVQLCEQSQPVMKTTDLGEYVCSVFLEPVGDRSSRATSSDRYIGETPPEGCPTNYRGAVKITNKIILHDQGMDTNDRGFDADGNLVWGAKEDSYEFKWLTDKND